MRCLGSNPIILCLTKTVVDSYDIGVRGFHNWLRLFARLLLHYGLLGNDALFDDILKEKAGIVFFWK